MFNCDSRVVYSFLHTTKDLGDPGSSRGTLERVRVDLTVRRERPHLHQTMHVDGKLVRQGRINAVAPGRLVPIVDETSQRRFLVDTGVLSPSPHGVEHFISTISSGGTS